MSQVKLYNLYLNEKVYNYKLKLFRKWQDRGVYFSKEINYFRIQKKTIQSLRDTDAVAG